MNNDIHNILNVLINTWVIATILCCCGCFYARQSLILQNTRMESAYNRKSNRNSNRNYNNEGIINISTNMRINELLYFPQEDILNNENNSEIIL